MPSAASITTSEVYRATSSGSMLAWSGERCETSTKAMPSALSRFSKNALYASRPPAEAPMPTISGRFGCVAVALARACPG